MSSIRLRGVLLVISTLAVAATVQAVWSGQWRMAFALYAVAVAGLLVLLFGQLLVPEEWHSADAPRQAMRTRDGRRRRRAEAGPVQTAHPIRVAIAKARHDPV